uniref:GRIP domain-containing protein n=1 Tax=Trypanosoma vivax (strain Y486) TaxID=1055687 RepID=G0TRW4_TRYVY|nr:conserved hypothetical protein [Trypanosoma vivax Y486]
MTAKREDGCSLREELRQVSEERDGLKVQIDMLRGKLVSTTEESAEMRRLYDVMQEERTKLSRQYNECVAQLRSLQAAHEALREEQGRTEEDYKQRLEEFAAQHSPSLMAPSTEISSDDEMRKKVDELSRRLDDLTREKVQLVREREHIIQLLRQEKQNLCAALQEEDEMLCNNERLAMRFNALINELATLTERQQLRKHSEGLEKNSEVVGMEGAESAAAAMYGSGLEARMEEYRRDPEVALGDLAGKLSEAQELIRQSDEEKACLLSEKLKLEDLLSNSEVNVATLSEKLNEKCLLVDTLTNGRDELTVENMKLQQLHQQLEQIVANALACADIEVPSPAYEDTGASFAEKVTMMAGVFVQLHESGEAAKGIQKEWAQAYEEARSVNNTLTQHINEAWKSIGLLREELSLHKQLLVKAKEEQRDGAQLLQQVQQSFADVSNELQLLKEEKKEWQLAHAGALSTSSTQLAGSAAGHVNSANSGKNSAVTCTSEEFCELQVEVEQLRCDVHDRDDKLVRTQQALDNLQQVLDTFTLHKNKDIEERTVGMQMEIDELRGQLVLCEQKLHDSKKEMDMLTMSHRHELAAKNMEIAALHRKHSELRKLLDDTARQLNGDNTIDKRVISHLTLNFIHAFVAQKAEADEMLKVLSNLLNWDEGMQEKAGLLPGPSNPKPGQQQRGHGHVIRGFMRKMWTSSAEKGISRDDYCARGSERSSSRSIAELWVDFLMRESENDSSSNIPPVARSINIAGNEKESDTVFS